MSTSTNFLLRSIFSAIISLSILGAISASTTTFSIADSCTANIDVQYDSTGGHAILIVSHSGTPNSTIQWFDSSSSEQITVTASGEYCVTVYTETQCAVTKCVNVDIGAGVNCESYIIKEPLPEGGYMLIAETNDPHPDTEYQWSNGELTSSITVNQSGEYCLNVTSSNDCPSQACIYIDIPVQNDSCNVVVFAYPDTIYGGAYVGSDPSGVGPFTYTWSNGAISNGIDVQDSGEYCVTVTDAEGCIAVGCKMVEVAPANHIVEFTVPLDIQLSLDVQCYADTSVIYTGDVTDEFTTCGSGFEATYTDQVSISCGQAQIISRIWSLADDCGNVEVKTQTIIVADNIAPVFVVPADITLIMDPTTCWADTAVVNTGVPTQLYDNCFSQVHTYYNDSTESVMDSSSCGYTYTLTRVWFAIDDCGNQTTMNQTIVLKDTTIQNNGPDSCHFNVTIFEQARTTDVVALAADPAGVSPFSYLWSDGSTGEVLDVLVDGIYCLTVVDGNGCEGQSCYDVELQSTSQDSCTVDIFIYEIERSNDLVKLGVETTDTTILSSATWSDGSTEPYLYVQEGGNYCVTAIDVNGCEGYFCYTVEFETPTDTCSVWIEQIPQTDGSVKVWAHAQGAGSESYAWSNSTPGTASEAYFYTSESGQYCVTVYDANQCAATACTDVVISTNEPTDSCYSTIIKTHLGSTDNRYKLSVDAQGVGPFTVIWHDSLYQDGDYLYVEVSGTYCATVYDANQCSSNACIDVVIDTTTDSCSFNVSIYDQVISSSEVSLAAAPAGVSPYSYAWSNGDVTQVINVFLEGVYCVTATDVNGCEGYNCFTVTFDTTATPDSCSTWIEVLPQDDGRVKIWGHTTGVGPFNHTWSTGNTAISEAGEAFTYVTESGEYCITVVDANQCESQHCVDVVMPTTPPTDSCYSWIVKTSDGDNRYELSVETVGEGPYTIVWHDSLYQDGDYLYVEVSGTYCATVYDANQCSSNACIDVVIDTTSNSCFFNPILHSAIDPSSTGIALSIDPEGVGPYTIIWPDGTGGDYFQVGASGEYCVTVIDANGCYGNDCLYVEVPTTEPSDSCYTRISQFYLGENDNRYKLTAEAFGEGPFTIVWHDSTYQDGDYLYVEASGNYCATVYDANQCVSNACIDIVINPISDSCNFDVVIFEQERNIDVVKLGVDPAGVAPFTYAWSDGSFGDYVYVQAEGNFCVTITDANGCEGYQCYYVEFNTTTPDTCSVWIEQIPQADGSVKVWAHAQGAGSETYAWSNSTPGTASEAYFYTSESGQYCVTVYDANQCAATACIDVVIATTEPIDSCHSWIVKTPLSDLRYKLSVESEGVAPFTIVWHDSLYQDGDYLYVDQSGNYCVTVYDANQCESNACIQVQIDSTTAPNDSCGLELVSTLYASDFVAEVKAEATGIGPFTYSWSDGTSGNAIEVSENQEVCVTVTDAKGCVSSKCIDVEVPERPCSLQIGRSNNSTDTLIILEAIADGEGEISYTWNNGSNDNQISISESGEYCLTITAANGCSKTECIFIDIENLVCSTEISINPNSTDYEVILDASPSGAGPFTFEWSNGSLESTIVVNESGTYCVTVNDARGCVSEYCKEVFIAIPECDSQIAIKSEKDDEVTIEVETNGKAPFTYYWSNGEGSKKITVTVSKEYCVEVIDALGCISYDCKYIEVVDYSTCSVEIEVISNADSTEHKVIANPSGTAPFTYEWAHGDTSRYFYPQLDGYFCVTVTDAEGCVSETCYKTEGITPSVELEAFPNPAKGDFFVEIDSELEFQGRVEIRDIKGNLLFTVAIDIEKGIQGMNFSSDEYPSGVFFVNIIRGSHVESIKVIKAGN